MEDAGSGSDLPCVRAVREGEEDDPAVKVCDYVVLEEMRGGSLCGFIRKRRDEQAAGGGDGGGSGDGGGAAATAWPWAHRLRVVLDVAEGMAQMHAKRYIHRDLKSDNVLLDEEGRAKVADLGLARTHDQFDVGRLSSFEQRCREEAELTWATVGGTPQHVNTRQHNFFLHLQSKDARSIADVSIFLFLSFPGTWRRG